MKSPTTCDFFSKEGPTSANTSEAQTGLITNRSWLRRCRVRWKWRCDRCGRGIGGSPCQRWISVTPIQVHFDSCVADSSVFQVCIRWPTIICGKMLNDCPVHIVGMLQQQWAQQMHSPASENLPREHMEVGVVKLDKVCADARCDADACILAGQCIVSSCAVCS